MTATQKFNAIHPIIRVKVTELYIYRFRIYKDSDTFIEEVSAVYDKTNILDLYNTATEKPFSFLHGNSQARTKRKCSSKCFTASK